MARKADANPLRPNVFLVGAGPGDPGLFTLRGLELIEKADVLLYDRLVNSEILQWAPSDCRRVYVGKNPRKSDRTQRDVNEILVEEARNARCLVRLKGGDPFVFGRGGEEIEALHDAGIDYEIVPGVTSAIAGPAYAGIPVTHRDAGSMVTIVTGQEDPNKPQSAINFDLLIDPKLTVVLLMSMMRLEANLQALMKAGRDPNTPAAVVSRASYPIQETAYGTLGDLAGKVSQHPLHSPAVVVVGEVAGLRATLKWYERRPLFGKRIVLTRQKEKSRAAAARLATLGAQPIRFPCIETQRLEAGPEAREALANLDRYRWVVFTSQSAVEIFMDLLIESGRDARALGQSRIAVVGEKTQQACLQRSLNPDKVGDSGAQRLAEALHAEGELSQPILFPCAEKARRELEKAAEEAGGKVDRLPIYRTLQPADSDPETAQRLANGEFDGAIFMSPSAVQHFFEMTGADPKALGDRPAFCVGPSTRKALENAGWPQIVMSDHTDEAAVLDEAIKRFEGCQKASSQPTTPC